MEDLCIEKPAQDSCTIIGVRFNAGDPVDSVLAETFHELKKRGLRVAGLIQTRGAKTGDCACQEMHLRDLATGGVVRISENRGPESRGCHLDWQAMTALAQSLERTLSSDIDVLIVNRFGRSESEGGGFRGAIEKAVTLGIRVIVAYKPEYAPNWLAFHGGMATDCAPDKSMIIKLFDD